MVQPLGLNHLQAPKPLSAPPAGSLGARAPAGSPDPSSSTPGSFFPFPDPQNIHSDSHFCLSAGSQAQLQQGPGLVPRLPADIPSALGHARGHRVALGEPKFPPGATVPRCWGQPSPCRELGGAHAGPPGAPPAVPVSGARAGRREHEEWRVL